MQHVIAVVGLAALCAGWVLFQRWVACYDPRLADLKRGGCGACSNGACESDQAGRCAGSESRAPR